jgi:hypothetical protein
MSDRKIVEALKELKIPMGNLGFRYIETAVKAVIADEDMLRYMTKADGLYEVVAKKHGSTPSRVERSIRHGIEVAFRLADREVLRKYIGHADGKETNRNFIALLASTIRELDSDVPQQDSAKQKLISSLEATLKLTRVGIHNLELANDELVIIHYASGANKKVNIACDSEIAIIRDVTRSIDY